MNKIRTERKDSAYFTMVPNIVDDSKLSVYAFRLYHHIRRVAGDNGECFQRTETLAEACNMSMGSVSNAKKELEASGLITINEGKQGKTTYDAITVVDIWEKNMRYYQNKDAVTVSPDESVEKTGEKEPTFSPGEGTLSPGEITLSPGETKNIPIKNIPPKKNGDTAAKIWAHMVSQTHNWSEPIRKMVAQGSEALSWDGNTLTVKILDPDYKRQIYGLAAMGRAVIPSACVILGLETVYEARAEVIE